MEINFRDLCVFIMGLSIGMLTLSVISVLNTTICAKCGYACSDSAVYCSNCGQQLRIVEEFKK